MAKAKVVNYTEEMTALVVSRYEEGETEEEREAILTALSVETGKDVKSLRAKLVREKVYIKKVYKKKTGGTVETKDKIVLSIALALGCTEDQLAGLDKATKPTLELIRTSFLDAARAVQEAEGALAEEEIPDSE